MSSPKYASPLILEIKPSRKLRLFAAAVVLASVTVALFIPLSGYFRAMLVVAVLAYAAVEWRRVFSAMGSGSVVRLVWDESGAWRMVYADGVEIDALLEADTLVQPFAVILQLRRMDNGRRCSFFLLDDNCDVETLRRLRVRLRHGS